MKRSGKIAIGIVIAVVSVIAIVILLFIQAVLGFFGYMSPVKRYQYKVKTERALEKRYPGHDFDVETDFGSGEYGFTLGIQGIDENGIGFRVQWVEGEMQDWYHAEWNKHFYGEKLVEYQNGLRDKYFPQIPYVDTYEYYRDDTFYFNRGSYKEVFFESMDDAIEGSKDCDFDTEVTFKGIDIYTADDEELAQFAGSIADSLMWLHDETGYHNIRIGDFYYREADGYGSGFETKDELVDSIIKEIMTKRKNKERNENKGGNP